MVNLSVNINKIATLRNARGGNVPDILKVAQDCQKFGADGITIHPRPDERHITKSDVFNLKPLVHTEYNIEGYPSREFIDMVISVNPHQVTLVPDGPDVLTSNAGWDTIKHNNFLSDIISEFKEKNIRTSIFIDPYLNMIENAKLCGSDRIELYTEKYAINYNINREKSIQPYKEAAKFASELDLGVNAGHDLNLENLEFFVKNIPNLAEVSIGHALISDSIYLGLENTVRMYKRLCM